MNWQEIKLAIMHGMRIFCVCRSGFVLCALRLHHIRDEVVKEGGVWKMSPNTMESTIGILYWAAVKELKIT